MGRVPVRLATVATVLMALLASSVAATAVSRCRQPLPGAQDTPPTGVESRCPPSDAPMAARMELVA
jgi:hypothetical protein